MGLLVGDKPAWLTSSFLRCSRNTGIGNQTLLFSLSKILRKLSQKGDEYYFCENILVEYDFGENIVYSEGHQTKPAEDNVHITQTNVFNVKQFNQNSRPQNQSHFESFKLNAVKRKVGRYLQFIKLSRLSLFVSARRGWQGGWQNDALSQLMSLTSGDACWRGWWGRGRG